MKIKSIIYPIMLFLFCYFFLSPASTFALTKISKIKAEKETGISDVKKILFKNPELAIKKLNVMVKKNPKNPKLYYYLGISYGRLNKTDKAIHYYKKAIGLSPKYLNAYDNLGLTYNKNRKYKKAYETFLKMVKINPKNPVYYNNVGFVEEERDKNHKAVMFFNKAVGLNPFYTMAYLNLGSIYRKMGENRRAAKEYNKSGLAYFRTGNYMQAVNSFKLSIKLYRRYIYPYGNIANSYVKTGNTGKAVFYYTSSGNMYNDKQRYHKAIKDFNLALQYNPKYIQAIHGIILSYQKLGNMAMVSRYMREEIQIGGVGAFLGAGMLP